MSRRLSSSAGWRSANASKSVTDGSAATRCATISVHARVIVAHHVAADPSVTDFDAFAERHPALLDKRLLTRHYSAATLASPQARAGWIEPDLAAFGWPSGTETA